MNRRTLGWIAVVIAAAVVIVVALVRSGSDTRPGPTPKKTRIGAAIALTGYGAAFGESESNAIALLRLKYPTAEFFVEDNKSDPNAGLLAVNKLIDVHRVDIVYCDLTTVANAVAQITKDRDVVLVAVVYLVDLLDRSPYAVRNLPRGIDESRLLLDYLKTHHPNAKTVAAVVSNDEFGRSSLDDFRKAASQAGMTVVNEDVIPDAQAQIASTAQKTSAERPDAIYVASLMPSLGLFIREVRVAGFDGVILTTDAFAYPYIQAAAGEYAKGTVYVDFPTTERTVQFAHEYKGTFSQDLTPTAVLCYDGLSIIIDACNEEPMKTAAQVVSGSLEGRTYAGLYGKVVVRGREIIYPLEARVSK